jgi:TPR repeat protein
MVPSVLAALKALALARKSSGAGSRYGQYVLACMHQHGAAGLALDNGEAVSLYRLAALQQLDAAQRDLGFMFFKGWGVAEDHAEALRCYLAAAAQGDAAALNSGAECHHAGRGTAVDFDAAIAFYARASAAGCVSAAESLCLLQSNTACMADA